MPSRAEVRLVPIADMEVRDLRSSTKGAGSHILIVGVRHPSVDNLPIKAKP